MLQSTSCSTSKPWGIQVAWLCSLWAKVTPWEAKPWREALASGRSWGCCSVTIWPSSRGSRFSLHSSSAPQISPVLSDPSHLFSGQQDPVLSEILGGLELSLTPPMGKCWNEEEGKPRAFVVKEQKTCSACPWVQLLQTTNQTGFFVLLLNASLANAFFKIIFSVCLFGRQSRSGTLHLARPAYPQSMHKLSFPGSFPLGFTMALQWPNLCVWYQGRKGRPAVLCPPVLCQQGSVLGAGTLWELQL